MERKACAGGIPPLSILDGPGRLPEELASEPVIRPGVPAYKFARETMRKGGDLVKRVRLHDDGDIECRHEDLPGLFVASLVDPQVAEGLGGCTVEYDVMMGSSWAGVLGTHPLWCPPYLRFVESFQGADDLLEACGSDTLDRLLRMERDPTRAVVLCLLRRDDAREHVRSYVGKLLRLGTADHVRRPADRLDSKGLLEVGQGLAARALLFAMLKHPKAAELAARTLTEVLAVTDQQCGKEGRDCDERAREWMLENTLHSGRSLAMWGLVHSLLDLGDAWNKHFAERARASSSLRPVRLPRDLPVPEIGGAVFAGLCRQICDEVADWYASPPKRAVAPGRQRLRARGHRRDVAPGKEGAKMLSNIDIRGGWQGTVIGSVGSVVVVTGRGTSDFGDADRDVELDRQSAEENAGPGPSPGDPPASMSEVVEELRAVASRDCTVLLTGEPGTGKGFWARRTHELSGREGEFVPVLCPTIPKDLFESELFGHRKGAFTGASEEKDGLVEAAAAGTLFLDEIAELPPHAQAKLLYLLQEKTHRRVGDTKEREARCRVVLASNRDLGDLVKSGGFREDLLARIRTFAFHLPPLRERRDEIPGLIRALQEDLSPNRKRRVRREECEKLRDAEYDWPGNVRTLRSAVERAFALSGERYVSAAAVLDEARKVAPAGRSQ